MCVHTLQRPVEVLTTCYDLGLETVGLSVLQQRRCENNRITIMAGATRVERRRMKDITEVVTTACVDGKIVKSRLKWAGQMV